MNYKPLYFKLSEFGCHCCRRAIVARGLIVSLEMLRRAWAAPIIVNSGYRCPAHNAEVGGSPSSRHMIGCAADIRPVDLELITPFQNLVGALFGKLSGWEIKMYPRFVHLAVPREEAARTWQEDVIEILYR